MTDPTSKLRSATRRAKSDVANKLISMFLHELSRKVLRDSPIKVESEEYASLVREAFQNRCPYCQRDLDAATAVVEHLDGMNRYRVGLHIPGNVLIACRRCNGEKRRDDSQLVLTLANTGWESFLSHNASNCLPNCATCLYWVKLFSTAGERNQHLETQLFALRSFRAQFVEFHELRLSLEAVLPELLRNLYSDCQAFAEFEIRKMLERF